MPFPPHSVIAPIFLEDEYAGLYRTVDKQGQLFAIFSAFAIFVASLGLYGLAAHMAERRTREIGVRKVVGARVRDIVGLLTWQFSKLVLIAAPVGIIFSVLAMNDWLGGFAYRISMFNNFWIFPFAGAIAFIIAWASVGSYAAKVARTNPIKALRYE